MSSCEYHIYYNLPGTNTYMNSDGSGYGFDWVSGDFFRLQPAPVVPVGWEQNKVAIYAAPGSTQSCLGQGGIFNNLSDLKNSELWGSVSAPGGSGGSGGGSGGLGVGLKLPDWLLLAGVVVGGLSGDNMRRRGVTFGNALGVSGGVYCLIQLIKNKSK